jgi:hypothetical protein
MSSTRRIGIGVGILVGLLLAAAVALWRQGPSNATVRRTVVTTIQDEAPASFLVTGTLDMRVTVRVDSAQFITPDWLTTVLGYARPPALALLQGGTNTKIQVPGTVSYGFNVDSLSPSMVSVKNEGEVALRLPSLSVHSVDPELERLKVRTRTSGWMQLLPSDTPDSVRTEALAAVEEAFRNQAEQRIGSATQPRVNTARALKATLRPPLKATGISSPRFRVRIGPELVMQPKE